MRNADVPPPGVSFKSATSGDVPAIAAARAGDNASGPADGRMAAYLEGQHHPGEALRPRIAFVAISDSNVIGFIAGHLTRRHGCEGEVQYLYVAPAHRRRGVATGLLRRLAAWFVNQGAFHVCVNINLDSPPALPFYRHHGATDLNRYWLMWSDARTLAG